MLNFLLFSTIILLIAVCFLAYKFYTIQKIAYNQIKLLTVKSKFQDIFYKNMGRFINAARLSESDVLGKFTSDESKFLKIHIQSLYNLDENIPFPKQEKLLTNFNNSGLGGHSLSILKETYLNRILKESTEQEKKFIYDKSLEYWENKDLFLTMVESKLQIGDTVWFRNRGNNKPQKTTISSISAGDFDYYFLPECDVPKISHLYTLAIPAYTNMTAELLASSEKEMIEKITLWKELEKDIFSKLKPREDRGETFSQLLNPKSE